MNFDEWFSKAFPSDEFESQHFEAEDLEQLVKEYCKATHDAVLPSYENSLLIRFADQAMHSIVHARTIQNIEGQCVAPEDFAEDIAKASLKIAKAMQKAVLDFISKGES